MLTRILAVLATATLAVGLAVGAALPASAHTPTVSATCSTLTVTMDAYGSGTTNTLKVSVDGTVVESTTFADAFAQKVYSLSGTVAHDYVVEIDAQTDAYDRLVSKNSAITGTTTPCTTAQCTNPLTGLKNFTIVTASTLTVSNGGAHVEGTAAVGTDLIVNAQYHVQNNHDGTAQPVVDGRSTGLLVGGMTTLAASGEAFQVNDGATRIGDVGAGTADASRFYSTAAKDRWIRMAGSATTAEVSASGLFASTFPGLFAGLRGSADAIAASTSADVNVVTTSANGGDGQKVTLSSGVVNLLRVTPSQLSAITKLWFAGGVVPSASTPFIIDVTGTGTVTATAPVLMNIDAHDVLWNFRASTLNLSTSEFVKGSILAPYAQLNLTSGGVEGQIAAASMVVTSGAEIHHIGYTPCVAPPTSVAGAVTSTAEYCDTTSYTVQQGSVTATAITGVTYELWNAGKSTKVADLVAGTAHPVDDGTYAVKVLPAGSSYTVPDASTWIQVVVGAAVGDCSAPRTVSGSASATAEYCDSSAFEVTPGSVTVDAATGVTYELWDAAKTTKIANLSAGSPYSVAGGSYVVKVLPESDDVTVLPADEWIPVEVAENTVVCETIGDPTAFQQCVPDPLDPTTSDWTAHLTIVAADHVSYEVFFSDGTGWVSQGIWAAGRYDAGTARLPYGTLVQVRAVADADWSLLEPVSWNFDFSDADVCDLPTGGTVTPKVVFAQTCEAGASYTLSIDGGVPGTVLWSVNGGPQTTRLGTFTASAPATLTIVATPAPGSGFDGTGDAALRRTFVAEFTDPALCDLETLAFTGQDVTPYLAIAVILLQAGVALVAVQVVRSPRRGRHLAI